MRVATDHGGISSIPEFSALSHHRYIRITFWLLQTSSNIVHTCHFFKMMPGTPPAVEYYYLMLNRKPAYYITRLFFNIFTNYIWMTHFICNPMYLKSSI